MINATFCMTMTHVLCYKHLHWTYQYQSQYIIVPFHISFGLFDRLPCGVLKQITTKY